MFESKNFIKTKFDALDGKVTVAWKENSKAESPFEVRVTSSGLVFQGKLESEISTQNDLQEFASFISDCWVEHMKLAPKIYRTLSGH